jgi:hypothetical protein
MPIHSFVCEGRARADFSLDFSLAKRYHINWASRLLVSQRSKERYKTFQSQENKQFIW